MELRMGKVYQGCDCWRRNGLQDDCKRWDCDGRPECMIKACPPSIHPPYLGVRHKNGFETVPKCKDEDQPFGPFPMKDIDSFSHPRGPPMAPMKGAIPEDVEPCMRT